MINGKPVTVQPDYKWGRAQALGIGDENDVYLVTTGLGDEMNKKVAEQTALALNCHDDMLAALKLLEEALRKDSRELSIAKDTVEYHIDGATMYHAINAARRAIAKAEGRQ